MLSTTSKLSLNDLWKDYEKIKFILILGMQVIVQFDILLALNTVDESQMR